MKQRILAGVLGGLVVVGAHDAAAGQGSQGDPATRLADRQRALEREASDLERQEKTLLSELRKLEIDRQLKTNELAAIERDLKVTREQLAQAARTVQELQATAEAGQPDIDERLVRIYKMGRAGYWRLLLDVDDVRAMGRAYRTAAALNRLDRERVERHQATLASLENERAALEVRAREISRLQARATAARASLDRAVAARQALVTSIGARQDLAAQLAAELRSARQRLEAAVAAGRPVTGVLPLRLLRGDLPWPADGIVIGRFGRHRNPVSGTETVRNGLEMSLAEGRPVTAVHDGVVSYAAPFTGYGMLVIVEHGEGTHTLYGHLASASVNKGDRVEAGRRIGVSGRNPAGNPALYFEVRVDGQPVDPLQWLRKP
jgi:septal ring factor EnvC (AmiA/AmiB activator)